MNAGITRTRPGRRFPGLPVLVTALAYWRLPASVAAGDVTVSQRDGYRVIDAAVAWRYQKEVDRQVVDSACYFDPEVENSLRCAWSSSTGGADPWRLRRDVKRRATKRCKKADGRSCVLFWRNGEIRFDGLSPVQAEKFESALRGIAADDPEALSLPEGVEVDYFRGLFKQASDGWERWRKKNRGHNPHYALCANERSPWSSFGMQGPGTHLETVRGMCVLKCQAISRFVAKGGACYVVYQDGEFASPAAERAIRQ